MTHPPLVAVAHGSRDPAAARTTEALLAEVRRQRPGLDVQVSYLDHVSPRLSEVLAVLDDAVVVPLLLGAAYHSRIDVPAAIADAGAVAVQADVLGPDPLLLDALERRLSEAGVPIGDRDTAVVLAAAGSTDDTAVAGVRTLAQDLGRLAAGGRSSRPSPPRPDRRSRRRSRRSARGGRRASRSPRTCSSPACSPTG